MALATFLCAAELARGLPHRALSACAVAASSNGRLRARNTEGNSDLLATYARTCARALAALVPPVRATGDAVRQAAAIARTLRTPDRRSTRHALDALDAVITAGRGAPGSALERRVVRQLARMLRARVLFHRLDGKYVDRESQEVHTLSSWTMRRLARCETVRSWRIKRRPEFWRPEQRRPRGVITFPVGNGNACLARSAPFRRNEARAVRTVLRFLATRNDAPGAGAPPLLPEAAVPRRHRIKGLVGSCKPWRRVLEQVWRVAPARCSVLLQGETGTGKELLARAIHLASNRAKGPFVTVNCAAVHAEVMHSELFGHVRGAFTGADRNRRGLLREAHRGTLFLDELGDMPMPMQVALLRALEARAVRPLGAAREVPADVRIVAATHQDLERMVKEDTFREDLYHRINVVDIHLPPLRARLPDLAALAHHVLSRMAQPKSLHMDALAALASHDWPGNVRELDNVLQAAALLSNGDTVGPEIVEQVLAGRSRRAKPTPHHMPPRSAAVLRLLQRGWRSAPHLAERVGVSTRTMNRELGRLAARGLVEVVGEARARRYRGTVDGRRDSSR